MALSAAKKELVKKKQRACFQNARIETYEIVIIINEAWQKSFERVEFNKKVIAVRGWFPLTRNLLDHPDIAASASKESSTDNPQVDSQSSQLSVAGMLNYQSGFANTVLSDILQSLDREAIRDQIHSNQEEGRQAMESLLAARRLTAGLVFKSGRAWLGPEVLEVAVNRKRKKEEIENGVIQRQLMAQNKRKLAYEKAWNKVAHLPTAMWSVPQLKALVSYKKLKTDKWPQLKNRAQLLEKWEEVKDRTVLEGNAEPPPSLPESAAALLSLSVGIKDEDDENDLVGV
jgi:hypothetical protein